MKRVMVRYKLKADRAAENVRLVEAVFEQLRATKPDAVRYATFRLEDGVSFVHFASIEAADNPLAKLAAFQAFTKDIGSRCEEPPVATELTEVGAYRFFGG